MVSAATGVEVVAAMRPARMYKPSRSGNSAAQLAAVLAAVAVRDRLAAASGPERKGLQREYAARVGDVVSVFARATKRLVRGFQGEDYLGQAVSREDMAQAVALGVAEAVARYRPERARGGCVFFVLSRVRFALQQLTGSQRRKYAMVGLEDAGEVGEGRIS